MNAPQRDENQASQQAAGRLPRGGARPGKAAGHPLSVAGRYDFCDIASRSVPQFAAGEWELLSCQLSEATRHHANVLASYVISFRRFSQREQTDHMIAKLYGRRAERARTSFEIISKLYESGFGPPSIFRVPQPLGYSLKPGVLFVQKAPGVAWREYVFLGPGDLTSSSERAAEWLLKLHRSNLSLPRGSHLTFISRLRRLCREMAQLFRGQSKQIEATMERIAREIPDYSVLKPSHGDFHARHLYLTPEISTAIDLDSVALREPEADVGYAAGHLIMMSWYHDGSYAAGLKAANAFLEKYVRQEGLRMRRVRLHIALAIVQSAHYGIVMLHPRTLANRVGLVEDWISMANRYLDASGKTTVLEA